MFHSKEAPGPRPDSNRTEKPHYSPDWRYPFTPRPGLKTEVMRGGGYRIVEPQKELEPAGVPVIEPKRRRFSFLRRPLRHK